MYPTYHAKNGWHFTRTDTGSVVMEHRVPAPNEPGEDSYTIDAKEVFEGNTWASIIASVSLDGDIGGKWQEALTFHGEEV